MEKVLEKLAYLSKCLEYGGHFKEASDIDEVATLIEAADWGSKSERFTDKEELEAAKNFESAVGMFFRNPPVKVKQYMTRVYGEPYDDKFYRIAETAYKAKSSDIPGAQEQGKNLWNRTLSKFNEYLKGIQEAERLKNDVFVPPQKAIPKPETDSPFLKASYKLYETVGKLAKHGFKKQASVVLEIMNKIAAEKTLVMLRGISGTGKSALARKMEKKYGVKALSTDDFFMEDGEYNFNPKKLGEAHSWNFDRAKKAIAEGKPVIIDNTNAQAWEMKPYVEEALKHGYNVEFVEPNWSAELKDDQGKWNVDFIEKLQYNPDRASIGKSLPREILERMRDRYEHDVDVPKVLKSKRPF